MYGDGDGANCFASVNAAIMKAAELGVAVVVNGSDGMGDSGAFDENVIVTSQVPLLLQRGPVSFGLLSSSPGDATPAAESVVVSGGATLEIGDPQYYINTSEYDGSLSGAGSLVEDGIWGSLVLGGPDSLAGGTTINSGNIVLTGVGSITGAGGVTVNNGYLGPFTPDGLAGVTVNLDGGGALNLYGLSAATLGGLNSSDPINLGSTDLSVGADGDNTTVYGAITGTAPLTKVGTGAMTFDGTGSTVPITVDGGTIRPAISGALAGDTVTLDVGGPNPITGNPQGLDLGALSAATVGGLTGGGAVDLGDNDFVASNLTVGANNSTTTYDGVISGTGALIKTGTGTLTLTASGSAIGATTVDGGTLELAPQSSLAVDGSGMATVTAGTMLVTGTFTDFGGLTVAAGAALDGPGTVYGPAFVAGTIDAGSGGVPGTLLTQDVTMSSAGVSGTLSALLGPTGNDLVTSRGSVDLANAELRLAFAPGYTPAVGSSFEIIFDEARSIDTSFANLPVSGSVISAGGQFFAVTYAGRTVTLTDVPTPATVASVAMSDGVAADGTTQRSEVRDITVTFSGPVSFAGGNANAAAAFQLQHVQDGIDVQNMAAAVSTNGAGQTVVTLAFTTTGNASTEIDPISAENGGGASLADGRFQLTISSTDVSGAYTALYAGGPDGDYVSPTDTQGGGPGQVGLFRLFGDSNGDGMDDQLDLAAFRTANNSNIGNSAYVAYLDADNSGTIDQIDLGQFRSGNNSNIF